MSGQPSQSSAKAKPSAEITRSEDRVDFVKRLFAVTMSVGVAGQLLRILQLNHSTGHSLPVFDLLENNWRILLLLFSSVCAVVASWEGYLNAVRRYPLEDVLRFYIDITLVFVYLLLTITVEYYELWFCIHVVIFVLYVIWDHLRCLTPEHKASAAVPLHKNSMMISYIWLFYFIFAVFIKRTDSPSHFIAATLVTMFGVIFYRFDKAFRFDWPTKALSVLIPIAILAANRLVP